MNSLAETLARPEILALIPYSSMRNGQSGPDGLYLDANESPFSPLISGPGFEAINRYPHPQPPALVARLAEIYGVETGNVLIGRGIDEAIDLLVRVFCRPGEDAIAVCPPTFEHYETAAAIQGARIVHAALTQNFELDFTGLEQVIFDDESVKLIFLCSPMNPTGGVISANRILSLCEKLDRVIVVVDEAYVEFAAHQSLTNEAANRQNLVVLRTLSKAYGLAGARCGAAIAVPQVITLMRKVQAPYPLTAPTIEAACKILSPVQVPVIARRVEEIIRERSRLYEMLQRSPYVVSVFKSSANFLFMETRDSQVLKQKLATRGIRVRWQENISPGGLRLTIGTPDENDLVLEAFEITMPVYIRRIGEVSRETKETQIAAAVNLDQAGEINVQTGIGYFDHMLEQIAKHGGFSLILSCAGDLEVDAHHTIEDCMLTLGEALRKALGDKRGLERFGFALPMDEAAAEVLIDLSGRSYSTFDGKFSAAHIGDYPTEMTAHAFRSLADTLGAAIQIKVRGDNDHHKTEACFKAFGRAMKTAIRVDGDAIASTKGVLS